MKRSFVLLALLVGLGLIAVPAYAGQIYLCQSCTAPPGGDPNLITDTSAFDVGYAGNHTTVGPLLIIVGVYDGGSAPTVSYGTSTYTPGGTAIYGWDGSASATTFSSADGTNSAYKVLGILPQGGGSSEQFGNWNTGETNNGFAAASSFSLYVYELTGVTLNPTSPASIDLEGATNGSYVLAYACEMAINPCRSGKEGSTPFTNSGLVDAPPTVTPEPAGIALMATFLVGACGALRRRFLK